MLVDSHCHLDYNDFKEDFEDLIKRAKNNGVCAILDAGVTIKDIPTQLELSNKYPFVWTAIGVHPHEAKDYENITVAEILKHVDNKNIVAIGECGLDYYYEHSPKEIQRQVFEVQIKAAQECGLPLMFHIRDADDDFIEIIDRLYAIKPFKAVIHCFSGTQKLADFALSKGFYLSASGIITFNKSVDIQEVFKTVPLDKLMIETDAPFLAPVPFRGKRNEPAFVLNVAEKLSQLKNVSFDEVAEMTTKNFFNLFRKASDKK
ncbi:MAG: TatD family hydrolase [Alphaproteobacteria bacterium]